MHKITENALLGANMRGCNTGAVVTSAGVVVIDAPIVPAEDRAWRQEVEQYGEIKAGGWKIYWRRCRSPIGSGWIGAISRICLTTAFPIFRKC